jgi:CYTH domain-containing protein
MAQEIERKFLVDVRPPDLDRHPSGRVEQGYVAIDDRAEVRVRRRGDKLRLTVKSAPARTRVEEELELDEAGFESLWSLSDGRRIDKTRYEIPHEGVTVELDVYHGDLDGLMTAEVEFGSEADSDAWEPPDWLGPEITGDARYANQALAVHGRPPSDRR